MRPTSEPRASEPSARVGSPRQGRAPRLSAGDRLQRLLSLLPWVATHDGPTVDEVCGRFDVERAQLLADLELASMVGVHPYTPDELLEVVVEDDRVWVRFALSFRRPLRLSPDQGLALVAAGSGLLAVPGADPEGPLARGLAKLATTLGIEPGAALDIDLGDVSGPTLETLRAAIDSRRQVELDYYAYGRDDRATRVVDPYRVFTDKGQTYVLARCHRAGGDRLFRVDRVAAIRVLGTTFTMPDELPSLVSYHPRPDDPRVTLELARAAWWVAEQYPVESVQDLADGRRRVTMAVSARPWLERLLLRLGPDATAVPGDDEQAAIGPDAARRVLARYRQG